MDSQPMLNARVNYPWFVDPRRKRRDLRHMSTHPGGAVGHTTVITCHYGHAGLDVVLCTVTRNLVHV
jgi:hypothetical protein